MHRRIPLLLLIGAPLVAAVAVAPDLRERPRTASLDSLACAPTEQRIEGAVAGPHRRFAPGERLEYSVSFGPVHVGSGVMHLAADTLEGSSLWRAMLSIDGGLRLLAVHDTNTSWFDSTSLVSRRFNQRLHEPRYRADRDTRMFPERAMYQQAGDTATASVPAPMDEVAMVYFVRTLPLEPGQCYELHTYFQPEGNPLIIHVLRRERVKVPAGTFSAIVLRPEIRTAGIFSQNGRAELWLSDDSSRYVLQLKSQLSFGSINLYLRAISGSPTRR
jgi:hypothetical protein